MHGQLFHRWREFMSEDDPDFKVITKKEVCSTCHGSGTTWLGRPSHDAVVFTESDMADMDDDEIDAWMGGSYDGTCPECNGQNVVDVIDEERTPKKYVDSFQEWVDDYYADIRTQRMEMGLYG